ncbi:MAG: hypothetical protein NZ651_06535 [Candidatus Bipolaricaulota bacterium]|nr:hypothetical protein [Candidatus Bipolaricaulota bacterium]MDW8127412.1 hypothetical protein [Candidatus Bipolaricaulota bacterium]
MRGFLAALLSIFIPLGAQAFPFSGEWDLTLQLFPTTSIYSSSLALHAQLRPGWYWEGEFYFGSKGFGSFNSYISGSLGDLLLDGKIYFDAEEVRYRRAWLDIELPLSTGTITLSANHWASATEYTSDHAEEYGPWPCVNVISWADAWCYVGWTLYVQGPVVGYERPSYLRLYIGRTDRYRFEAYISSSYLPKFEEAFGKNFWETWAKEKREICVYGEIKDYRYTTEGGYSVPQVALYSVTNLYLRGCCGFPARPRCPPNLIRWFEAKNFEGQRVYVQGPIVSYASEGGVPNRLLRIGGGGTVPNRLELYYTPGFPDWFRSRFSVGKFVCVYGTISLVRGVARIVVDDPSTFPILEGPCCEAGLLPGHFLNWRVALDFSPLTVKVDFGDCSAGTVFRRLVLGLDGLPFLCCGLFLDASLTLTKCFAFESLSFTLRDLFLPCCGITGTLSGTLTAGSLSLAFEPKWLRLSGCVTVYGDLEWKELELGGLKIHGWSISCYFGNLYVRAITALDPDAVEEKTDITFYEREWEYLRLDYAGKGCCGEVDYELEFWFGEAGTILGLQRLRIYLEFPISSAFTTFCKAQWNFALAVPLQWFDLGWSLSF